MPAIPATAERRAMGIAALALSFAALPVFLVAGLAVQVRADLGFGETALGAAITIFFVAAGTASVPGGRLSDRIGARRALLSGATVTVVGLVVIATAGAWGGIAAGLALAGLALGFTEPGIALLVARHVPTGRQGLAFGVKEAAIPGATLLAGVAVPAIALTVGWRWAFGLAPLLWPAVCALVPRERSREHAASGSAAGVGSLAVGAAEAAPRGPGPDPGGGAGSGAGAGLGIAAGGHGDAGRGTGTGGSERPRQVSRRPPAGPLTVVAIGSGVGVAAVTAMSAFLVEAAVAAGLRPSAAGLLLAGASVGGIVGRVAVGWLADRSPKPQLPVVALMLVGGAGALGLLALSGASAGVALVLLLAVGSLVAFGVGWGWTGLLFLSVVRASPGAPAGAVGIALAGLSVGGALGPLLFGLLVAGASFSVAWTAGAAAMLGGAVLVLAGERLLAGRRASGSSA